MRKALIAVRVSLSRDAEPFFVPLARTLWRAGSVTGSATAGSPGIVRVEEALRGIGRALLEENAVDRDQAILNNLIQDRIGTLLRTGR